MLTSQHFQGILCRSYIRFLAAFVPCAVLPLRRRHYTSSTTTMITHKPDHIDVDNWCLAGMGHWCSGHESRYSSP